MDVPVVGLSIFNRLDQCPYLGECGSAGSEPSLHFREDLVGLKKVAETFVDNTSKDFVEGVEEGYGSVVVGVSSIP